MNRTRRSERGQVLILIVFGMIALIGMTALAVDGGNAYSDRRHAQNAADTAALAAGLSLIRHTNVEDGTLQAGAWDTFVHPAGMTQADQNGYNNDLTSNVVTVLHCSDPDTGCVLPDPLPVLYDGHTPDSYAYYIRVTITSHVPTYFAKVLGIGQITNSVEAIVHAVPPIPTPWYNGNALVATMPGCKPTGWPADPFVIGGGSGTEVTGAGGVFINSTCAGALKAQNGAELQSVSGVCIVPPGTLEGAGLVNPPPSSNCSQIDFTKYQLPAVSMQENCDAPGTPAGTIITISPGQYLASPGRYDQEFPPNNLSAGTVRLAKGIYCLENGLAIHGSDAWSFTTDIDGNGTFDGSDGTDEGVLFYVPHGGVTFNANSNVDLGAINKPGTNAGIKGYLFYLPPDNPSTVTINGDAGSTFIGTILAPNSLITLSGGSDTESNQLQCQIIGYSISVTGGAHLNISFSQSQNGKTYTNPSLNPYR